MLSFVKKIRTWCPYVKKRMPDASNEIANRKRPPIRLTQKGSLPGRPGGIDTEGTEELNRRLPKITLVIITATMVFAAATVPILGWDLKFVMVFLIVVPIWALHFHYYMFKKKDSPWEPSFHKIGPEGVETYKEWKEVRRKRLRTRK